MKKLALIVCLALFATPAFAQGKHKGWGHHGHHKSVRVDGPLPLAAGLPALALIGGVLGLAHRARKRD